MSQGIQEKAAALGIGIVTAEQLLTKYGEERVAEVLTAAIQGQAQGTIRSPVAWAVEALRRHWDVKAVPPAPNKEGFKPEAPEAKAARERRRQDQQDEYRRQAADIQESGQCPVASTDHCPLIKSCSSPPAD